MPDSKGQHSSYTSRRNRSYDDDQENEGPSHLPRALLIGAVVGIVCVALNVALTFLGTPIFHAYANAGKEATGSSYALIGLGCVSFFIQLFACFIAGFIVGKTAAQRQPGFYAGILAAAISYLASFVVRYIPNYPGNLTNNTSINGATVGGGIVTVIVFLIIWSLIGGLIGLWGARVATRNHPDYASESQE
jgi:hypothetical protein